jgi:hypothetical protein
MSGIVYVLTNPAMQGYVKVGRTRNLEKRMKELDNTSTPLPFECAYAVDVDNPEEVELLLHDAFADGRTRSTREFFEVNPERIISALRLTKDRDVTPETDIVEDEESRRALARTNKMREAFNFGMVGIVPGTMLTFIRDPSQTCEVLTNRTVLFEGEETSLSASARTLLKRVGWSTNHVAGPVFWCLEGESLNELRKRIEEEE